VKPSFDDARLKLERANKHISDLDDELRSFLATNRHHLTIDRNSQTGEESLRLNNIGPVPRRAALVIGDAIHNLRVSLDYCACQIALASGGSNNYVKFPFRSTAKEVEAAIKGGDMKAAPASIVELIVNEIRPYKGGNDALVGLHELDISDKHILLTPIVSLLGFWGFSARLEGRIELENCTVVVQQEGALISVAGRIPGGAASEIKDQGRPILSALFGPGQPFQGEPIVQTLRKLSEAVSGCIDVIDTAYSGFDDAR